MSNTVYKTPAFKKRFKKYQHNQKVIDELDECVQYFLAWKEPKEKWYNHRLHWPYEWFWELHLFPNVLLIYEIYEDVYTFHKIGSHPDLFG